MTDPTAIALAVDLRTARFSGTARDELGGVAFDVPFVSHIEGNLWQGGCANGLVLPDDIMHVVSLYPWEQYEVRHQPRSLSFHWLYDDANADPPPIIDGIADWVIQCLADGPTLVHCQAGLNRSSLIAALALIKQGRSAEDAIALLRARRSPAVLCNQRFEAWQRRRA